MINVFGLGDNAQLSSGPSELSQNIANMNIVLTDFGIGTIFLPGGQAVGLAIVGTTAAANFALTEVDAYNTENVGEAISGGISTFAGEFLGQFAVEAIGLQQVATNSAQYLRSTAGQFMSQGYATLSALYQTSVGSTISGLFGG